METYLGGDPDTQEALEFSVSSRRSRSNSL
jgi:hypothetical protein